MWRNLAMGKIPIYNSHGEIVGYDVEETPEERAEWMHQYYLDSLDAWGAEEDDDVD